MSLLSASPTPVAAARWRSALARAASRRLSMSSSCSFALRCLSAACSVCSRSRLAWAEGRGQRGWAGGWAAGWAAAASGHGARPLLSQLLSGAEGGPEQAGEHPTRWVAARAPSCERGHLLPGGTPPRAPPSHGASRPAALACRLLPHAGALRLEQPGEHAERLRRGRRAGRVAWQRHRLEQRGAPLGLGEQTPHAALARWPLVPQPLLGQARWRGHALHRRGAPPTHAADVP